jgi:CHASE3 domain sensor protein
MTGPESMADERVIRLLEEIRDLQREQGRRSADALRGQQESIRLQQAALRRVRIILAFASAALILAVGMLVLLVFRVLGRPG